MFENRNQQQQTAPQSQANSFFDDGLMMPAFSFPSFGSMFNHPFGSFMDREDDPFDRDSFFNDNIGKSMKHMNEKMKDDMADMSENMKNLEDDADASDPLDSDKVESFSSKSESKTGKDGKKVKHSVKKSKKCKNGECEKVKCVDGDCFIQETHHLQKKDTPAPANSTKTLTTPTNSTSTLTTPANTTAPAKASMAKSDEPQKTRVRVMGMVPTKAENGQPKMMKIIAEPGTMSKKQSMIKDLMKKLKQGQQQKQIPTVIPTPELNKKPYFAPKGTDTITPRNAPWQKVQEKQAVQAVKTPQDNKVVPQPDSNRTPQFAPKK